MRTVQDFLTSSSTGMVEYIAAVSSEDSQVETQQPSHVLDRHEKMRIMNAVHQRFRRTEAPVLHKEAIPLVPHMIDLPKHLAVITSIVVRHTRRQQPSRPGTQTVDKFDEFCSSCLQVEEQALRRVSQLASRRRAHSVQSAKGSTYPPLSPPPPIPRNRKSSGPNKLRSKKSRPATAPEDDPFPAKDSSEDASSQSSPVSRSMSQTTPTRSKSQVITSISAVDARREPSSPPSSFRADAVAGAGAEPRSMPAPRPPFLHHPRSSSTDSALARKQYGVTKSPSMPLSGFPYDVASENPEESSRKSKGLLRGILRR